MIELSSHACSFHLDSFKAKDKNRYFKINVKIFLNYVKMLLSWGTKFNVGLQSRNRVKFIPDSDKKTIFIGSDLSFSIITTP